MVKPRLWPWPHGSQFSMDISAPVPKSEKSVGKGALFFPTKTLLQKLLPLTAFASSSNSRTFEYKTYKTQCPACGLLVSKMFH